MYALVDSMRRRITLLVRWSGKIMFWVTIVKETRRRVRIGVYVVQDKRKETPPLEYESISPEAEESESTGPVVKTPPRLVYRVMAQDKYGVLRPKGPLRKATWAAQGNDVGTPMAMVTATQRTQPAARVGNGKMIIIWYEQRYSDSRPIITT